MYICLYISISYASSIINNFSIIGNFKTPKQIILEQIKHPLNTEFNVKTAQEDQQRIYNLDIFSYVQIGYNNSSYVVIVQEKKNVTFKPILKKTDGIGWTYGTEVLFNNINGTANKAGLSIGIGQIELGQIKYIYKSPFNHGEKLSLSYNIDKNKDIDDEYNITNNITSIIYQKKFKHCLLDVGIQNHIHQLKLNDNKEINYSYLSQLLQYLIAKKSKLTSSNIKINFNNFLSSNIYNNYQTFSFNYQYVYTLNEKYNAPTINMRTKIYLSSNNTLPLYEKKYIGGDLFVRGYEPKTSLNPTPVINKLKFNNVIFASLQFEIPWFKKEFYETRILFFIDQGMGSNQNNSYDINNRIIGYGFGFQIITKDNTQFDIHVGLNKYHNEIIHFMVKRNV